MSAFFRCLLFAAVSLTTIHGGIAWGEDVYTLHVKGVVKALPRNGLAKNEILVKHEPISDYRDESGKVVGMSAMTMPFYLDETVSLKEIGVGDSVELVVEQRIRPRFSDIVVSIKKVEP